MRFALPETSAMEYVLGHTLTLKVLKSEQEMLQLIDDMHGRVFIGDPTAKSIKLEEDLLEVRARIVRQNSKTLAKTLNTTWS